MIGRREKIEWRRRGWDPWRSYMATIRQVELWLKEQSQVTELSNPFLPLTTRHFPSPLQGSTLKFQSFFPIFFSISFKAFTATVHASNLHQFTTNFSSKRIISHQIRSFSKEENGNCRGYFGNSSVPSSGWSLAVAANPKVANCSRRIA